MSSPRDVLPEPLPARDSRISEPRSTPPAMGSATIRPRSRFSILASGCLLILLVAQCISLWPFAANVASAASKPSTSPSSSVNETQPDASKFQPLRLTITEATASWLDR